MPYRLELLFITWLTCFSIAPKAIAVAPMTAQLAASQSTKLELSVADSANSNVVIASPSPAPAAEPPASQTSSQTSSRMEWVWWGALALAPTSVIAAIFYSLRPRQLKQRSQQIQAADARESLNLPQSAAPSVAEVQHNPPKPDSIVLSATTRLAKVDVVEVLIQDLRGTDVLKRRSAIWELGQRGDSRAIQPLVDLLVEADSKQRGLILAAVSEIGTRTLKPLHRALLISLQDDSSDVRKNAIRDVTRIVEWTTQISQVLQYATSDTDAEVRETAEWALGQLNRIRPLTLDNKPDTKSD
jgi:hypothetical protein